MHTQTGGDYFWKKLFTLTIPIMVQILVSTLLNLVDNLMVGADWEYLYLRRVSKKSGVLCVVGVCIGIGWRGLYLAAGTAGGCSRGPYPEVAYPMGLRRCRMCGRDFSGEPWCHPVCAKEVDSQFG